MKLLSPARTSPHPLARRLLKSAASGCFQSFGARYFCPSLLRSQDPILACALLEQQPLSQSGVETLGPSVVISNSVLVKRMVDHYLKPSDLQSPGWAWHLNAVGVSWPSVAPVKSFGSADPFLPNLSLSLSGEGLIWFPDQFD